MLRREKALGVCRIDRFVSGHYTGQISCREPSLYVYIALSNQLQQTTIIRNPHDRFRGVEHGLARLLPLTPSVSIIPAQANIVYGRHFAPQSRSTLPDCVLLVTITIATVTVPPCASLCIVHHKAEYDGSDGF